ncbi:MAG: UDP-N-acetylmuramoyl-L-alanyl-D-glutamate--2,6-diaminopimelate ligase [Armatimonadetes bacterium CG07_land_8_20_14_0_80_40_9]|nr:MAG: UDP-N-acetylmuramoyl-L-alanyl-D-glutamate--2,6-diaminopimelate ligase [Armatimonadetes bacterium CG07_land_8_20_14_0_80_40_9]
MVALKDLIQTINEAKIIGEPGVSISGIAYNSKRVRKGSLFVCIKGFKEDGHKFVPEAILRGAKALVVERDVKVPSSVSKVLVKNSREALALLSSSFFAHPSQRLKVIGVTGTNGKTTTTYLIESILTKAGFRTGVLGTITEHKSQEPIDRRQKTEVRGQKTEVRRQRTEDRRQKLVQTHLTTPESYDLQRLLSEMVKKKVDYVVMEVSSHALSLGRVRGCEFDLGVFTNLTQDHLDFHQTLGEYLSAKIKLFTELPRYSSKGFKGVINLDDPAGRKIISKMRGEVMTFGIYSQAEVKGEEVEITPEGANLLAQTPKGKLQLRLKLTGLFNVYNALAALAVGLSCQIGLSKIKEGLEEVDAIPGRLERIDEGQDFMVFVDYAHTPDGLKSLLGCAREISQNKLLLVFGCGGDRDKLKRPLMGEIANRMADWTIITSDNPRGEEPEEIMREIEKGFKGGENSYTLEVDRYKAISKALGMAKRGDLVLIAGKGHETYQKFKDTIIHFDDREVARQVLRGRSGKWEVNFEF